MFLIFVCWNQKPLFCFKRNERQFVCLCVEENTEVEQNQRPRYRFSRHFLDWRSDCCSSTFIYLFIFFVFCFYFLGWIWIFVFEIWEWIAKRANDVQKQIYISSLWTDRRAHIRAESCGYWCPLWQSTFRLTWIYLFILFFKYVYKSGKFCSFVLCLIFCCNFGLVKLSLKRLLIGL